MAFPQTSPKVLIKTGTNGGGGDSGGGEALWNVRLLEGVLEG